MGREPVWVTGIGAITPIGFWATGLWQGILSGKSGIRSITRFDPSLFATHIAGEVDGFDPADYLDSKQTRRLDLYSQYALSSTWMALKDAGLTPGTLPSSRTGICLGTALGGIASAEQEHTNYQTQGLRGVSPLLALTVFAGAGSCNIAIALGVTGPTTANGDSCASAPIALGNAFHYLQRGEAEVMLAGGSEAPLSPLTFGAFALIRAMSQRNHDPATASRPFDRERDGFVMAEGSAMLVLETRRHAQARGAVPYAELAGYSLTNDGNHMTAPRADGFAATAAMRQAIERAGLTSEDICAVSAHGSSTPLNDSAETGSLKQVFGERAYRLPVFGTKGAHGHALGATGAFEAALCCLALRHGILPPTINRQNPDPDCDLDYITEGPRPFTPGPILSNSFGFGGINSCLVFKPVVT